ncbi:MAG TPA: ribose-5-phosphate isomerase RpiA [Actinomycetota bacterium]|jgi:ribose 5-phosphate isomerase A
MTDEAARMAAVAAALARVEPGVTIGLGSGRAVFALVQALAARWPADGPRPRAVVASDRTGELASAAGFELVELGEGVAVDHAFDGADEVDADLGLVKGGGAALLREKLVMAASRRVTIMAEAGKRVPRLGLLRPLPVEVVRFAWPSTRQRLQRLLPTTTLRLGPDGRPLVTDEGHHILDGHIPEGADLHALAAAVKGTLGVVEHGLFLDQVDEVLLGHADGTVEVLRPRV